MFILKKENLMGLLNKWSKEFDVLSPQKAEGEIMLLPYKEDDHTLDYVNFVFPVKEYLFKQKETLFNWEINKGTIKAESPDNFQKRRSILFGIRPCDLYGITYMDKFFLQDYKDDVYERNREAAWVVAINCLQPGKDCFCSSMGTGPFAKSGYDVLLTPIDNLYLVEIGSKKGEELLVFGRDFFIETDERLLQDKGTLLNNILEKFQIKIKNVNIRKVLDGAFDNPIWQQLSKECVGCTGCTSMCPTCTCFNVVEENCSSTSGRRVRYWDSCQSDSFTRNAGEHNPRNSVSRVRYRIYDKFKYIEEKTGMKGCTGCGRCINVCPASINVVNIINSLSENIKDKDEEKTRILPDEHHIESCESVYLPQVAVIKDIIEETKNIKRFVLQYEDKRLHDNFEFKGQFFEITVFGVGEIAISIPFSPSEKNSFDFCIKKTGKVTEAIHRMKIGDKVGLRGPFGKGFPDEAFRGRDIIIIGSGVGLAPVRTMILRIIENRKQFGRVVIIGSAMSYEDLVYRDDLISWGKSEGIQVLYALSNPTSKVKAHVGYINDLLPGLELDWRNTSAIICASPRRIKAVAKDLLKLGMKGTDIYTSLETHMRCGIGKCGHCKVGSKYMCVDGPVFNYEEMLELPPEF